MADVADVPSNLTVVRSRIEAACRAAGRDPDSVRLLPVSKNHGLEAVRQAWQAGVRRLGENRVQEAADKWRDTQDLAGLEWAMIGHLQTNKARDVARFAAEFQALDSLRVARELDKRLQAIGRGLDVLIEVNSSGEPQKYGVAPEDVPVLAAQLRACDALRVRGLMTVAVNSDDPDRVAACFDRVRQLAVRLRDDDRVGGSWEELSMGMSGDFELAIAHGATCVRIGTAIFGPRAYR